MGTYVRYDKHIHFPVGQAGAGRAWGPPMAVCTDALAVLERAIDDVVALDPALLGERDAAIALLRDAERVAALATRAAAAFDARGEWQRGGASSAARWLARTCNLAPSVAKRRVALGRDLRVAPSVRNAWLAGEISEAHAQRLVSVRTRATASFFERDEAFLVEQAKQHRFADFQRIVGYWFQCADADGVEDRAEADRERNQAHMSQTLDSRWRLDADLDSIAGTIFNNELKRLEQELYDEDLAKAKAEAEGRGEGLYDIPRTNAQRKAAALVEMAMRSRSMPEGSRSPEPLFSVFVGYETFAGRICELANGMAVTPGSLVPYLSQAHLERIVFDTPSRVFDVGVKRRLFTGATRRAVEVRDRQCFHEFCDLPAEDCQIDHIEPYAAGGLTVERNGRAACGRHNRDRHRQPPPPVP